MLVLLVKPLATLLLKLGHHAPLRYVNTLQPFTVCKIFDRIMYNKFMYNKNFFFQEAVSKEMKRIHRPPFYTDREGIRLTDEEWQLFQNVMFLKSVTVKVTQPQESIKSCLVEVCAAHSWVLVSE